MTHENNRVIFGIKEWVGILATALTIVIAIITFARWTQHVDDTISIIPTMNQKIDVLASYMEKKQFISTVQNSIVK